MRHETVGDFHTRFRPQLALMVRFGFAPDPRTDKGKYDRYASRNFFSKLNSSLRAELEYQFNTQNKEISSILVSDMKRMAELYEKKQGIGKGNKKKGGGNKGFP